MKEGKLLSQLLGKDNITYFFLLVIIKPKF